MTFTKKLVNADRISMFLVDEEKEELYADYFDEGEKDEHGNVVLNKKAQIRFNKELGIAGYVAKTGEVRVLLSLILPVLTPTRLSHSASYFSRYWLTLQKCHC